MLTYTKPLPVYNAIDAPYWQALFQHELRMQKCSACDKIWFPPGSVCPKCLCEKYHWEKLKGTGKIWSWVVFHKLYIPSYSDDIPYNVAAVKLDEGPMLTSNIVQCSNDTIKCDMPVEIVFDDVTKEITLPVFRPSGKRSI